jgi:hypothetical protein
MTVEGKIKINGFLRVKDLNCGEPFVFEDDDTIYMKADGNQFVNLDDGSISYDDYDERPVRRINAKIVVED